MAAPEEALAAQEIMHGVRIEDIPAVFDVGYLAQILGVSRTTAHAVTHRPGFPVVALGPKLTRIYKPQFLAWLETCVRTAGEGPEAYAHTGHR